MAEIDRVGGLPGDDIALRVLAEDLGFPVTVKRGR